MLAMLVPGINLIAIMLMMVPYAVLYTSLSLRSFLLHLLPVWVIAYAIMGFPAIMLGIFALIPALIMGYLYRKRMPASRVIVTTIVTILALILLELLVFDLILGVSLIGEMSDMVRTMIADFHAQGLLPQQWDNELTELFVRTMVNSIPLTVIIVAFLYAVITHYLARRALVGIGLDIPGAPPAREWMLPRIMVAYYLIAYVLQLFVSGDSTNFLAVALINLVPLLRYAFAIQAVGFIFFLAHQRGWNRAVPVILSIPVLLFPPFSLLGVLDAAFPIRKSITKR